MAVPKSLQDRGVKQIDFISIIQIESKCCIANDLAGSNSSGLVTAKDFRDRRIYLIP